MKRIIRAFFPILLATQICFAQWIDTTERLQTKIIDVLPIRLPHSTHTPGFSTLSLHPSFYDRKSEWQWIIDSTWGLGEALSSKLNTFDTYQNFARAYNSTFLWNPTNWDSLVISQRSKVNDLTSRGGFQRILNDLIEGIKDGHAYAYNDIVAYSLLNPGTPLFVDGSGYINHFGAGLTPLQDSSLLVYRVVPNHPLGLEPGDIILGYEGVPWYQIVHELLDGNVPYTIWRAPAASAYRRYLLESAGESWHLFDTIDVVKHTTGLTEHLPLDPMVNLVAPDYIINNEQIPIPGVPMPLGFFPNQGAVTYGIIDGTNIGYIYVYHEQYHNVSTEFDNAVQALMQTDGLIIDIRVNWGGSYGLNDGISRLMNHPTFTLDMMKRCSPQNLFELCPSSVWFVDDIPSDIGTFYERPIAVLIGSGCLSYGDITSWQLTYVPNAKFFGRPPAAAYSGMVLYTQPSITGYSLRCPDVTFVDHYFPSEPRWGEEFPDFEEVWLTPDGVANGEDDVVNRAVEWINNLVYPYNTAINKSYYAPGLDSIQIFTTVNNPNSHQVSATAYLNTLAGVVIDSVNLSSNLFNSGSEQFHGVISVPSEDDYFGISITAYDLTISEQFSMPNAVALTTVGPITLDSVYALNQSTYSFIKPLINNHSTIDTIKNVSIYLICNDPWVTSIIPEVRNLPDIPPGSIIGPSAMFRVGIDTSIYPNYFNFKIKVLAEGWGPLWTDSMRYPPIAVISINPTQLDFSGVQIDSSATKSFNIINYGDEDLVVSSISSNEPVFTVNITNVVILPDSSQEVEVTFTPILLQTYSGVIEIVHNAEGSPDSIIVTGDGVTEVENELGPLVYALNQNYPNPFNPTTVIKYSIPEVSKVTLKLYTVLGEEVSTLVNEEKVAGYYKLEFNAANLPSGVYFYQIKAGSFVETKKMILIK